MDTYLQVFLLLFVLDGYEIQGKKIYLYLV